MKKNIRIYEDDIWLESNKCPNCHNWVCKEGTFQEEPFFELVDDLIVNNIVEKHSLIKFWKWCYDCDEFFIYAKLKDTKKYVWIGIKCKPSKNRTKTKEVK